MGRVPETSQEGLKLKSQSLVTPSDNRKTKHLPTAGPGKKSGQRRHILLVEDHEPTRLALAQSLRHRRYKVSSAASFAQALSLMKKHKDFVLLISDIGLPDGRGYDLMNEFRRKFGGKGIALTGYGSEQDLAKSESSGFTAHLTKPVRIESLENALAAALKESAANIFTQNGMPR